MDSLGHNNSCRRLRLKICDREEPIERRAPRRCSGASLAADAKRCSRRRRRISGQVNSNDMLMRSNVNLVIESASLVAVLAWEAARPTTWLAAGRREAAEGHPERRRH